MTRPHRAIAIVALLLIATLLGATGCSSEKLVWVDEGTSYTMSSVERVLETADISAQSSRDAAEATALRHAALTSLRKQGPSAAKAADLLTATFPAQTRAVPVYVESATLGGKPVIVLVEATGPKTGPLTMKRLWVLGEDGSVILSRTR